LKDAGRIISSPADIFTGYLDAVEMIRMKFRTVKTALAFQISSADGK
jgi:hypothetical protein